MTSFEARPRHSVATTRFSLFLSSILRGKVGHDARACDAESVKAVLCVWNETQIGRRSELSIGIWYRLFECYIFIFP